MESLPPDILADFRITLNRFKKMVSGVPEQDRGEIRKKLTELTIASGRCTGCSRYPAKVSSVIPEGVETSSILVVDCAGELLTEEDGRELLFRMFQAIGYTRTDLYITSVYKCRTDSRSPDPSSERPVCLQFLDEEIRLINPVIICTLGTDTGSLLTGTPVELDLSHGHERNYNGRPLFPIRHPLFLLENPEYKKETWQDLQNIRQFLLNRSSSVLS